jgi:hypothetical protein
MNGIGGAVVETGGSSTLKSAGKVFKPVGYLLDAIDAGAGYRADVKRGASWQRALIDNGSRVGGGILGGVIGSAGGPIGSVGGSYVGGQIGKLAPDAVRDTAAKARQLLRELDAMQDPRYFPSRREREW